MRRLLSALAALLMNAIAVAACNGTTGDQLITFPAYAAGAKGAGNPFEANGYTIQLTYAHMYIGAVYVNQAPAQNGGTFNSPSCIDTGVYCAQVPAGLDVDLLSTSPQQFPVQGSGSADLGLSWELYLTQGDVNNPENTGFGVPNTADLVGTAKRQSDGKVFKWAATVTINESNRGKPAQYPGQPGANPICKQRIIEVSGLDLQFFQGGALLLTIDPRAWFKLGIDFSALPPVSSSQCMPNQQSKYEDAEVCIPDSSRLSGAMLGAQQGIYLFTGIFTGGSDAFGLSYSTSP